MRVLLPLPDRDFDVTEVAVPWQILREAGHEVVIATEQPGTIPAADPRLLTGVVFGKLGAAPEAVRLYQELTRTPEFAATQAWAGQLPVRALARRRLPVWPRVLRPAAACCLTTFRPNGPCRPPPGPCVLPVPKAEILGGQELPTVTAAEG